MNDLEALEALEAPLVERRILERRHIERLTKMKARKEEPRLVVLNADNSSDGEAAAQSLSDDVRALAWAVERLS